jgi:opacity protein-like surface antigen
MKKFAFAALAVTSLIWGTTAATLRQPSPEPPAIEDSGWSITETGAAPGWSIAPAHARMW